MKATFIGENEAKSITLRGCTFPQGEEVEVKCESKHDQEKLEAILPGHPEFEVDGSSTEQGDDELEQLKKEADELGVSYNANVKKAATLRKKIEEFKATEQGDDD